jgi:hypothetical protein
MFPNDSVLSYAQLGLGFGIIMLGALGIAPTAYSGLKFMSKHRQWVRAASGGNLSLQRGLERDSEEARNTTIIRTIFVLAMFAIGIQVLPSTVLSDAPSWNPWSPAASINALDAADSECQNLLTKNISNGVEAAMMSHPIADWKENGRVVLSFSFPSKNLQDCPAEVEASCRMDGSSVSDLRMPMLTGQYVACSSSDN